MSDTPGGKQARDELFRAIDDDDADAAAKADSKVIYDHLSSQRQMLGGIATIPLDDRNLSERILDAATKRSREMRGSATVSAALQAQGRPVGLFIWALWALALIGAGVALAWLW